MIMKKSAFLLGMGVLLGSAQSVAHDHHHGKPLSEVERKASEGIFDNKEVKDRALSDWDGIWQSLEPYLLNGDLDPVLEKKSKAGRQNRGRVPGLLQKGYATNVEMIGIEDNVMEFHTGNTVNRCRYDYAGYKILTYTSGKKGVRYLFECTDSRSKAPKYVQFSDHIIAPRQSQHFHIFMGECLPRGAAQRDG